MDILESMVIQTPYNTDHRKYNTKHNFRHMAKIKSVLTIYNFINLSSHNGHDVIHCQFTQATADATALTAF